MGMPPTAYLSSLDAGFLLLDSGTTPQSIAVFSPCDRTPKIEDVAERFRSTLLVRFPRLASRLRPAPGGTFGRLARPAWERDPMFDLSRHVQVRHLPGISTEADLLEAAADLFGEPLPFDRPLWRFTVLTNTDELESPRDEELAGVLFTAHHALTDGLGGMEMLHVLCGADDQADPSKQPTPQKPDRPAAALPRSGRSRQLASAAWILAQIFRRPAASAITGNNSPRRRFTHVSVPLDDLKTLRAALGVSLNTLYLTLVTSALRRYQVHRGREPLQLCSVVPFNLRTAGERFALGNHLTGIGVPLPTQLADMASIVQAIEASVVAIKSTGAFGALRLIAKLNSWLPAALQRRVASAIASRTHCICTNMPSVRHPLRLGGATILGEYGCAALMKGHGLSFTFMSYSDRACFSVVSDAAIVPDPGKIADGMRAALTELRAMHLEGTGRSLAPDTGKASSAAFSATG